MHRTINIKCLFYVYFFFCNPKRKACISKAAFPSTGTFNRHLSLLDTVKSRNGATGTITWPIARFPLTVVKYDEWNQLPVIVCLSESRLWGSQARVKLKGDVSGQTRIVRNIEWPSKRVVGMLSQLRDKHLTCTPEYECLANIPVAGKVWQLSIWFLARHTIIAAPVECRSRGNEPVSGTRLQ